MNTLVRHRINFYSIHDGAIPFELKKTQELLDNFVSTINFEANDYLEYYNIKIYFDNNLFLENWNQVNKEKYVSIIENTFTEFKKELVKLNDSTIEKYIENIEFKYLENFWNLFNKLNLFKHITGDCISKILKKESKHIRYILENKNIVDKYDKKIKEFLVDFNETTEIILSKSEEKHSFGQNPIYYFPKSLSLNDKELIVDKYLDNENSNLNYVRLIENSKDSSELKLSPKLRLKAKKLSQKLNSVISKKGHSWNFRVQVGISKDQEEPVIYNNENNVLEVIYSDAFLNSCLDNDVKLVHLFTQLFQYLDETNLVTLVSKTSEIDSFESTFMKSKNAYETGEVFTKKEYLSNLQLIIFDDYLKRNKNSIENIINSFIDYLNKIISPNKIYFKIRISDSPFVDKIRSLAPEYDFLLKQFKLLSEDGEIDLELIQLDSKPIYFSDINSLNEKKYLYSNNDLILYLKFIFFSNQSMMNYIEPYKHKYNNLYNLLLNENVKLDNFKNYQQRELKRLISENYLIINEQGFVKIENDIKIFIVGQLHLNEVISYWIYPELIRHEIDVMIKEGLLKFENTLLTIPEKNYFNYYLNKKEYTNGFDLRNKYLHGTNSFSEDEHKFDYYMLLKVIILTLLKIEDDILTKKINTKSTPNN